MQLKECMEDTADNKVWGDWMLINLCVLCSVQYFCLSSSLLSCIWFSRLPLKGMTKAPGSWLSTHSLIFTNLAKSAATELVGGRDLHESICNLHPVHAYSWRQLSEHVSVCRRPHSKGGHFFHRVWLCFHEQFATKKFDLTCAHTTKHKLTKI